MNGLKIKKQMENEMRKRSEVKIIGLSIVLFGLMIISTNLISAATNITNCQTLSSAGETYTLNTSISNNTITTDCMNISAQNITLDCRGYYISSTQNYTGVYSNQFNTTIRNCNINIDMANLENSQKI